MGGEPAFTIDELFFSRNWKIQRESNQTLRDWEPAKPTTLEHGSRVALSRLVEFRGSRRSDKEGWHI